MKTSKKFKRTSNFGGLLPIAIILVIFAFATIFFSISAGLVVIALVFAAYSIFSLWAYLQTRNIAYFAAFLFQLLMAIYFFTVPKGLFPIGNKQQASFFYILGFIVMIWLIYLMVTQKGSWKGKNIFELAARQINESANRFSERPRPTGKMEYTKSELFGFAEFIKRNLIAIPCIENNKIVFVLVTQGDEYLFLLRLAGDYNYHSRISFDFEGNVSASISKKDYLAFTEELAFDQLCDSLGKLFIEFMEYSKKNETERILHRIYSVKSGFFS